MSQREPSTAASTSEHSSRCFVRMELPFVINEGPTTRPVVDSAVHLAVGTKLASPPAGTEKPLLHNATRLSSFQMPLAVGLTEAMHVRVPSVPLDCILTNDALLRVQRRVTIRRVRRRGTGELLSEEVLSSQVRSASWCGVVSRRCSIARPLDFVYLPHQLTAPVPPLGGACTGVGRSASVVGEGDVFPPATFVPERLVPSFPFDLDTSTHNVLGTRHDAVPLDKGLVQRRYVSSNDVLPGANPFPPVPSAAHVEYMRTSADAPEWVVLSTLLQQRPIWEGGSLVIAMKRSGKCPSAHANLNCIRCMTYSIVRGPFHRLRIAYSCNPMGDATYAVLQRIVVRIQRRSPLGVALRDACRMPNIRELIHACCTEGNAEDEHGDAIANRQPDAPVLPFPVMGTMRDAVADFVSHGSLWGSFQIIDLTDHAAFRAEAMRHIESFSQQHGFYTDATLQRLSTIVVDQIRTLVTVRLPMVVRNGAMSAGGGGDAYSEADSDTGSSAEHSDGSSQHKRRRDDSDQFSESADDE